MATLAGSGSGTVSITGSGAGHVARHGAGAGTISLTGTGTGQVFFASGIDGAVDLAFTATGMLTVDTEVATPPAQYNTSATRLVRPTMKHPGIYKGVPLQPAAVLTASLSLSVAGTAFDEGQLDTIIDPLNPPGGSTPVLFWRASDLGASVGTDITTWTDAVAGTSLTTVAGTAPRVASVRRRFKDGAQVDYTAVRFRSWRGDQLAASIGSLPAPVTIMWVGRGSFQRSQGSTYIDYFSNGDFFTRFRESRNGPGGLGFAEFGNDGYESYHSYTQPTTHLRVFTLTIRTSANDMVLREQTGQSDQEWSDTGVGGPIDSVIAGGRLDTDRRSAMFLTDIAVFNEVVDEETQEALAAYWMTVYKINRV